jgi:hypothetical protein
MNFILKLLVMSLTGVLFSLLVSCSTSDEGPLGVRQFHLSQIQPAGKEAQMVRGEQLYRLRGAVTMEELQHRLGQYYTVSWKNDHMAQGGMKVVMDYQQAATGSKVLRMSRDLPVDESSGRIEFQVTGESYRIGGRVLAWRIRLQRGDQVVAEKRSYLWR